MPAKPNRRTYFRPTLESLEKRLQPGSLLSGVGTSLLDSLGADLNMSFSGDQGPVGRILRQESSVGETPHRQSDSISILPPSGSVRTGTERVPQAAVTHSAAGGLSASVAQNLQAMNAAAPRLTQAAASHRSAAPLSSHPSSFVAQSIPTQGDQPHVTVLADAVSVQPMTFATVQHRNVDPGDVDIQMSLEWSNYVTGATDSAIGHGLAVDSGSNSYVTGSAHEGDNTVAFVAKYASSGRQIYYSEFQAQDPTPGFTYGSTEGHGIAVDPDGNAYVTGVATRLETGNRQAFAMKVDPFGNVVSGYGGGIARTATSDASGEAIGVDTLGQATLTGSFAVNANETEIFAVKFNNRGTLPLYAVGYQFPGFDNSDGQAIALDATADNVYLAGWAQPTGGNNNILAMKLDNTGSMAGRHVSWATSAQNTGPDLLTGIAVNSQGNAYVSGTVTDTGQLKAYIAKFLPDGSDFDGLTQIYDNVASATSIAIDSGGNSYFTGGVTLDDGNVHAVIAKVDLEGNPVDSSAIAGNTSETGAGIAFRAGNAFLIGTTSSTNLSSDGSTFLNGTSDAFVAKVTNFN